MEESRESLERFRAALDTIPPDPSDAISQFHRDLLEFRFTPYPRSLAANTQMNDPPVPPALRYVSPTIV